MTTPILAQHSKTVYQRIEKEAVEGLFTGSLTKLYDECGISRSFYRRIFAILQDLSCITVITKGHGATPSKVQVHREPTDEELLAWDLTRGPHSDKTLLESRLAVIEQRLGGLDIKRMFQEVDRRLGAIERQTKQGER